MKTGSRRLPSPGWRWSKAWLAALALLSTLASAGAHAATFGHARLASSAGDPLRILVPVSGLTDADLKALTARPAPAADWARAGLNPPVALDSLQVTVAPGMRPQTGRVLEVRSSQVFAGSLADLLLDVRTATGEQRYQVSLVAPAPAGAQASPAATGPAAVAAPPAGAVGAPAKPTSIRRFPAGSIRVRPGDTMFSIARRHAVDGVTIYQLMLALQRANPQAFIRGNINRVRAGASLAVPDVDDMRSISDAEARRQFMAQVAALGHRRGQIAHEARPVEGQAAGGSVSESAPTEATESAVGQGDRLRLTEPGSASADERAARGHALEDAHARVVQLQDNVQNLNQALQSQGEAARSAVAEGAQAIGQSIQKLAGVISEASHDAAAQAGSGSAAASGASGSASGTPGGIPGTSSGSASGASGSASGASGSAAAAGGASGMGSAGLMGSALGAGGAAAGASAPALDAGGIPAANTAAVAEASAHAEAVERKATERTRSRVSWLQDHLLGVMTGLLALIVFIIAWLLRRANVARDEADGEPRITEAMVQEKLQDIDLNLPGDPSRPSTPNA